jgi:hypothetical protein
MDKEGIKGTTEKYSGREKKKERKKERKKDGKDHE